MCIKGTAVYPFRTLRTAFAIVFDAVSNHGYNPDRSLHIIYVLQICSYLELLSSLNVLQHWVHSSWNPRTNTRGYLPGLVDPQNKLEQQQIKIKECTRKWGPGKGLNHDLKRIESWFKKGPRPLIPNKQYYTLMIV